MSYSFVIQEDSSIVPASGTESASLFITIDILPIETGRYFKKRPKLTVGVSEIPIRRAAWREDDSTIGRSGEITLARISDKDAILNSDSNINLDIVDFDDTVIENIFTNATFSQGNFEISGDSFTFAIISNASDKLNLCPTESIVIYDPARVPFDADEIEKVKDTQGNEYGVEDLPTADLMLTGVFDEIFVTRCGFSSYVTDIEDFAVKRGDFEFGRPVIEGIKPLVGMFEPLIYERDNVLYIRDKTVLKADGFPAPPDITLERVESLSISQIQSFADYAELLFSESDTYDGYNESFHSYEQTSGDSGDGNLVTITFLDIFANYYNNNAPDVVLAKLLIGQLKSTYNGTALPSNLVREDIFSSTFDNYARITESRNRVNALIPDLENPGDFIYTENVEAHVTVTEFAQHPHNLKRQYAKEIKRTSIGTTVIDTSNPYDWNINSGEFEQDWKLMHRSGNITGGMSYSTERPLTSKTEKFTPQRNGLVNYERSHYDHLGNLILDNGADQRAGDVSVNGSTGTAQRMLVFETDDGTITTGRKVSISVGELPMDKAIALARRILKRLKTRNKFMRLSYIGHDAKIKRGAEFSASDKLGGVQGSFLTTSFDCVVEMTDAGATFTSSLEAIQI